jgi:hypothetical protein
MLQELLLRIVQHTGDRSISTVLAIFPSGRRPRSVTSSQLCSLTAVCHRPSDIVAWHQAPINDLRRKLREVSASWYFKGSQVLEYNALGNDSDIILIRNVLLIPQLCERLAEDVDSNHSLEPS